MTVSTPSLGLTLALLGATLLVPSAHAQGRGGRGGFGGGARIGRGAGAIRGGRGASYGYGGYGWGYLPPPYYPDESGYWPPTAPPPPIPYSQVAEEPPQPAPAAKPIQPLLMEERGGQWVRVPNGSELPTAGQAAQASGAAPAATEPAAKLPSAVIVFKDGHREEVERYMIQGNVFYTGANYWTTGSWTRKIQMADLDVPATIKANEDRGAKFNLPTSSSEVMVRF